MDLLNWKMKWNLEYKEGKMIEYGIAKKNI